MNHHTTADFGDCYGRLPEAVQRLADDKYNLLRTDPWHPSLHFKRAGRFWSVRVGIGYRALALSGDDGRVGLVLVMVRWVSGAPSLARHGVCLLRRPGTCAAIAIGQGS